jgi:hypothetical protein
MNSQVSISSFFEGGGGDTQTYSTLTYSNIFRKLQKAFEFSDLASTRLQSKST